MRWSITKRIFILAISLISVLGIIGCNSNVKRDFKLYDGQDVKMEVIEIEHTKIKVNFTYTSDEKAIFGDDYYLEIKKNNNWVTVPYKSDELYVFTVVGYSLESDSEWVVDYDVFYGTLSPGTYRIIKSIIINGNDPVYISAEYTIQK